MAEGTALAFQAFPEAHWAKLRTNNVQERANREIKRRYRVVQSFPSVESMVRLSAASILSEEGRWATQRVFSEESAALGFREPQAQGGAREKGRPDSLGDSRELRPQEGVGFRQRRRQVMCLLTPRSCARSCFSSGGLFSLIVLAITTPISSRPTYFGLYEIKDRVIRYKT